MASRNTIRRITLRLDSRDSVEASILEEYDLAIEGRRHDLLLNYLRGGFVTSGRMRGRPRMPRIAPIERPSPAHKVEREIVNVQPVKSAEVKHPVRDPAPPAQKESHQEENKSEAIVQNSPVTVTQKPERKKELNFFGNQQLE